MKSYDCSLILRQKSIQDGYEKPIYVLTGSGILHHIFGKETTQSYLQNGKSALNYLNQIATHTKVVWIEETPVIYSKYGITNDKINQLQSMANQVIKFYSI